ncbi:MAG TPA: haloalkane dehalogenase, partial [Thermoanaerobaculia bacterium]|nr:haloalkane dehalogenase [Thermoanaerobaculia bacterium]
MSFIEPDSEELALLRADPLLWEQELDVRPEVARDLERALGRRAGEVFWRSRHDHLYSLELADLGRGVPSMAKVNGWWDRFEPRPPEHEIDADLVDLCLWIAEAADSLDPEDVRRVFRFAGTPSGWPEGSVLRTPEERFEGLPGFDWTPRFVDIEGLRMAYLEAGGGGPSEPASGGPAASTRAEASRAECFLLLHGEPTWSYLYRHMIPVLAEAGRVVVPDLVGFGRSDKPALPQAYSYRAHARWLHRFVESLDLRGVTMVCQDWGGLLGLRVLARAPQRFRRVVPMNTGFPCGEPPPEAFLVWRQWSQRQPAIDVPLLMRRSVRRAGFAPEEAAAYGAPFPSREHQLAARIFPRLVPTRPDHPGAYENRRATEVLRGLALPVLPIWGDADPITKAWEPRVRDLFARAELADTVWVRGAGHFLQEDAG